MNTTRINTVTKIISQIAGIEVGLTIRGEKSFTFHFEGENKRAMNKISNYFSSANVAIQAEYHSDVDYTCIFIEA